MSQLPQVRPKDLVRALEKAGFGKARQTGSHVFLKHVDGKTNVCFYSPEANPYRDPPRHLKTDKIKT